MIIRRFSLLWEDVLWQVLNICSNDLSPHFTTNLRWHFSCLQHEVFQINYHSTSEFITSEYSGIKVRAFLWSPPVHLCPVWPSHCTTGSAGPQVSTGHHQHLHMGPHSPSLSLWWGRHSHGPPHSLAASLSSGPMGRVCDLSLWLPTGGMDTPHPASPVFHMSMHFPPFHCSSDAEKPNWHYKQGFPVPLFLLNPWNRFHLSHCSSLTAHVCGIPCVAEAAGRAAPEEKMPALPGLCITKCLSYA